MGCCLRQWKPFKNNIWVVNLDQIEHSPTYVRELFINGARAQRARFPNQGYLRVKRVGSDNRTNFYFEKDDFPIPASTSETELILLHDWSMTRIPITDIGHVKTADKKPLIPLVQRCSIFFTLDKLGRSSTLFSRERF